MIQVYAFATPNSLKVPIALEELGVPYDLHAVNIRQSEQKSPAFLAMNANAKVPVLIDDEGPENRSIIITESAAILIYLAEKYGRLLPAAGIERVRTFEQLFFHASAVSPSFGQAGFFQNLAAEKIPFAIDRFLSEAQRVVGVLATILANRLFVAGPEFTIADIAHFGWMWRSAFAGIDLSKTPSVARWYDNIAHRPSVLRAIERVKSLAGAA